MSSKCVALAGNGRVDAEQTAPATRQQPELPEAEVGGELRLRPESLRRRRVLRRERSVVVGP